MSLDRSELERLYQRIETPLYNVVYRWIWQRDEAHDVVQEAFVRLWAVRDDVRTETAQAYVYRIALNLAAKRRRTRRLWQWVSLEALTDRVSPEQSSERRLLGREEEENVRRALDALSEPLRQVITLCELTDMSYDEVAAVLEVPVGTVGSRRNAAFKQLEARLAPFMEDSHGS